MLQKTKNRASVRHCCQDRIQEVWRTHLINIRQSQTTQLLLHTALLNRTGKSSVSTLKTKRLYCSSLHSSASGCEMSSLGVISIRILYRNTQYMKAQMSEKICSFKLLKKFFWIFFFFCAWTCREWRMRHSLFSDIAPHFPQWNTWRWPKFWTRKLKPNLGRDRWGGTEEFIYLESYIVCRTGLECETAVMKKELIQVFLRLLSQRWMGNSWRAFRLDMRTGRTFVKDMGTETG